MSANTETVADVLASAQAVEVWDFPDGPMRYLRRMADAHEREILRLEEFSVETHRKQFSQMRDRISRLESVLDDVEDQVRWTVAHLECGEYDGTTGALCTAGNALEYISRLKEGRK